MTAPGPRASTVAVVGDSAAVADDADLDRYLTLIHQTAGTPARAISMAGTEFRAALRDLPADVGAVFLPHASPEHGTGLSFTDVGVPVVTDRDTAAIALSAAVLTTLTRAGRPPRGSRVLIAGADTAPLLSPLLMAAGVSDITIWSMKDAIGFPLRRLVSGVHVVVDLLSITAPAGNDVPDATPAVVVPHAQDAVLALPGLLRALLHTPNARMDAAMSPKNCSSS